MKSEIDSEWIPNIIRCDRSQDAPVKLRIRLRMLIASSEDKPAAVSADGCTRGVDLHPVSMFMYIV